MTIFKFRRSGNGLDDEGKRANDALNRLMGVQKEVTPSPEWRQWHGSRRRRRIRRSLLLTGLSLGFAAIVVGGWFGGRLAFGWVRDETGLLRVQRVEVAGLERLTVPEILSAAGVGEGQYFFDVHPDSATARILRVPLVRTASVRRTWKREVLIEVGERHAVALAMLDRPVEVDEEAVVLPPDAGGLVADLPIINGLDDSTTVPGQAIRDAAALPAAALAALLARDSVNMADQVSDIWAGDPDSLVLVLNRRAVPVKVGRGDIPERRLLALRAVLSDLASKEVEVEYIDLRFVGQVVCKPRPEPKEIAEVVVAPKAVVKRSPAKKGSLTRHGVGKKGRRSRHGRNT